MQHVTDQELRDIGSMGADGLERLIYSVGTVRGGSSVLMFAIGIHDQILSFPGPSHFMNQVWRYQGKVNQRLLQQIFRLPGFYHEKSVLGSLGDDKGRLLKRWINSALASGDLRRMFQIYPLVFALDKDNTKSPDGIRCWLDKANDAYQWSAVRRHFPKAKFVFITRDPRGAVSSIAKRTAIKSAWAFDEPVRREDLLTACLHWRNMMQRFLRFKAIHPECTLILRFEDFVRNPEATMNRLFEFVGVDRLEPETIRQRLAMLSYGASNIPSEMGTGISTKPLDRWKETLSDQDVNLLLRITHRTARKLGYDLRAPGRTTGLASIWWNVSGWRNRMVMWLKLGYLEFWEAVLGLLRIRNLE
jgi:hypothetical protein